MKIINVKIEKIKPYKNNAKKHTQKQIEQVADSILRFGFIQPLVISKQNEIVIGHCRYEACKKLDKIDIPCIYVDTLSDDEVKALRLADNRLNESEWLEDTLHEELEELPEDLRKLTGCELENIKNSPKEIEIKESYEVICECKNENEMENLYNKFTNEGIKCRTLIL